MKLIDITPYTRFASEIMHVSKNKPVYGKDCRIIYVISGNFKLEVNGSIYEALPDSVLFCTCGVDYMITSKNPISLYALNFDLSQEFSKYSMPASPIKKSENHTENLYKTHIDNVEFLNSFLFIEKGEFFKETIKKITDEFEKKKPYFNEICSANLKELLIEMARYENKTTNVYSDATKKTIHYINANYKNQIKNKDIALITGYHEYYLNRIFLNDTGLTIHQFVIKKRITEAKKMLLNNHTTIYEIAKETGFNSDSHFSAFFKQFTGYTPLKYRNAFKNIV